MENENKIPFFKFENEGDKVGGYIRDFYYKPSDEMFGAQRVFLLEDKEGTKVYAPLKESARCFPETDNLQVGDFLGIKFDKQLEPTTKGHHGAKIYTIFPKMIGDRIAGKSVAEWKANVGNANDEFSEYDLPEDEPQIKQKEEKDDEEIPF